MQYFFTWMGLLLLSSCVEYTRPFCDKQLPENIHNFVGDYQGEAYGQLWEVRVRKLAKAKGLYKITSNHADFKAQDVMACRVNNNTYLSFKDHNENIYYSVRVRVSSHSNGFILDNLYADKEVLKNIDVSHEAGARGIPELTRIHHRPVETSDIDSTVLKVLSSFKLKRRSTYIKK